MTKSGCQGEMPYAMTIVDEIGRVNMHQRLDMQCGRGLDYLQREKLTIVRSGRFSFLYQIPRMMKLRVRLTQSRHLHGLMGASIIQMIERVNLIFFGKTHKENDR